MVDSMRSKLVGMITQDKSLDPLESSKSAPNL